MTTRGRTSFATAWLPRSLLATPWSSATTPSALDGGRSILEGRAGARHQTARRCGIGPVGYQPWLTNEILVSLVAGRIRPVWQKGGHRPAASVSPTNSLTCRACRCVLRASGRRTPSTSRGARTVVRAPLRRVRSALGGLLARPALRLGLSLRGRLDNRFGDGSDSGGRVPAVRVCLENRGRDTTASRHLQSVGGGPLADC